MHASRSCFMSYRASGFQGLVGPLRPRLGCRSSSAGLDGRHFFLHVTLPPAPSACNKSQSPPSSAAVVVSSAGAPYPLFCFRDAFLRTTRIFLIALCPNNADAFRPARPGWSCFYNRPLSPRSSAPPAAFLTTPLLSPRRSARINMYADSRASFSAIRAQTQALVLNKE